MWDYTASVAAETTLKKIGEERIRAANTSMWAIYGSAYYVDNKQTYLTQPNSGPLLMWQDLVLNSPTVIEGTEGADKYLDYNFQVCLCDASTDCAEKTNWQDLGKLSLEGDYSFETVEGQVIGGQMFITYSVSEVTLALSP